MALAPGTRLGAFEITGLLGTGGMGEVYRARDSKLKRDVALKVLPPEVASDPERLARFQREAEVLASLNHPHIAHIYGIEDAHDQRALVMELVEGTTLEERIARGALPIDEARAIALQIIDALTAAHEQGIVHRDLKPANIKLTPDGQVKVLDFGLAKALEPTSGIRQAAAESITSPAMTRAGFILGTAAYMAPEQARGVAIDKRADIWAFGVVLFETLSGRRLFDGGTVSDTLANVLKTEPDWSRLPPGTPPSMARLLRRCLEKERKRRLQDIGDARLELEEAETHPPTREGASVPTPSRTSRFLRAAALVAAGVALAVVGMYFWSKPADSAQSSSPPFQFLITSADGIALDDPPVFAVSPDGRTIALRGTDAGVPYVYLRSLVTGAVRRLQSTRGVGQTPFWSKDNASIGFVRSGLVNRVAIDDTRAAELRVDEEGRRRSFGTLGGQAWSSNGEIAFAVSGTVGVVRDNGGSVRTVVEPTKELPGFSWPWWLPDARRLLVQNTGSVGEEIYLLTSDGSASPRLVESGSQPVYVDPGWLLAARGGQLLAWKFDADRAAILGGPAVIRGNVVRGDIGIAGRLFSASDTGVVAIRNDFQSASTHLVWFERSGSESGTLKLDQHCRNPELSPDGNRVAMECYEPGNNNRDIWLYDLARDAGSRFTFDRADDADPLWSPDGRTVIFASNRNGPPDVFRKATGGASPEELMLETLGSTPTGAWSPDGRYVALIVARTIQTFEVGGDGKLVTFSPGPYYQLEPQFSPDGRFVSYSSDESGRNEVYVQPWPSSGDKWQVSTDGATDARWRPDGKELFYLSPTRELMAAAIDTSKGFHAGTPSKLFQTKVAGPLGSGHRFPYAVSRDGKRFLMYVSDAQAPPPSITVIVNWPALIAK